MKGKKTKASRKQKKLEQLNEIYEDEGNGNEEVEHLENDFQENLNIKVKGDKKRPLKSNFEPEDDNSEDRPMDNISSLTEMNISNNKRQRKKKNNTNDNNLVDVSNSDVNIEMKESTTTSLNVETVGQVFVSPEDLADDEFAKEKGKKNKKAQKAKKGELEGGETENTSPIAGPDTDSVLDENVSTVKTAAQKKKEKKERQKREAALAKQKAANAAANAASQQTNDNDVNKEEKMAEIQDAASKSSISELSETQASTSAVTENETSKPNKKRNKKDKNQNPDEKKDATAPKKKGIPAAMVAAMQERLKKINEEEERLRKQEEERIQKAEERERLRLEAIRLEAERKERKKQKEIERKARLKAEGKLLTKRQKEDRARAQAMLDALKAQGLEMPDPTERKPTRPGMIMIVLYLLQKSY